MKIGFLVNENSLSPDLEAVLHHSHKSQNFNVALIVFLDNSRHINPAIGFFGRLSRSIKVGDYLVTLRHYAFRILGIVEERFCAGFKGDLTEYSRPNIYDTDIPVIRFRSRLSPSGFVTTINDSDAEYLRSFGMNFYINGISLILRGKILDLSPMGVIGVHHGDNRKYRGRPSGFWELYERDIYTGYIFQKLSDQLDNGQVLFRGEFTTKSNYFDNVQYLHHVARANFVDFIDEVCCKKVLPSVVTNIDADSLPLLTTTPTISQMLSYIYKVYLESKILKLIKKVTDFVGG